MKKKMKKKEKVDGSWMTTDGIGHDSIDIRRY
jgi:hypothetical protein